MEKKEQKTLFISVKKLKKTIILLLPADNPTGPIKGAFAIANGLSKYYVVKLVFINKGKGSNAFLEKR